MTGTYTRYKINL